MSRNGVVALAVGLCAWGCAKPAVAPSSASEPEASAPAAAGGAQADAAAPAPQATAPSGEPGAAAAEAPALTAPADPATIRKQGNHLAGQRSQYLKQHAHNPIDWYPWGAEAFARARAGNLPILLSVGYSSCHWCHVMEEEVFEHDDVAAFLNQNYVCIKVDREERPDVDAIYMDAVQSMTGRGGWPMTLILTPDLRPFFAGTYLPRDRFMGVVQQATQRWQSDRESVERDASRVLAQLSREGVAAGDAPADVDGIRRIVGSALGAFDPTNGGFRGRMKFPTTGRWRFLLHAWRKWGGASLEAGVRRTLDAMAAGGIHDPLAGGFHRYTVEPTWLVPHFEKMLYDNAQLAALYFEAGAAFSEPRYTEVGRRTLDFLLGEMAAPGGGFYASFDADSGGEEGSFYVWTPAELEALAGPVDGKALAAILSVRVPGTFDEARSVPSRQADLAALSRELRRTPAQLEALLESWRGRLLEVRAARPRPHLDTKLVTSWNGLTLSALALGHRATGDPRYLQAARATADLLWHLHRSPEGRLLRASNDGHAEHAAILDDYAYLALGLLDLFDATGEIEAFNRARDLVDEADQRFKRPAGGWYLSPADDASLVVRTFDPYDGARPSGNAVLLEAMLRLAALTGDTKRWARVDEAAKSLAPLLTSSGLGASGIADVAIQMLGPYYEVVVAGAADAPETKALSAALDKLSPSWAVIARLPAAGAPPPLLAAMPALAAKDAAAGKPTAYVCVRGACQLPTSDATTFRKQLLAGWLH
ncbi:MAG: thioredoxin domain-containing protein [Myxococcota bacterium]